MMALLQRKRVKYKWQGAASAVAQDGRAAQHLVAARAHVSHRAGREGRRGGQGRNRVRARGSPSGPHTCRDAVRVQVMQPKKVEEHEAVDLGGRVDVVRLGRRGGSAARWTGRRTRSHDAWAAYHPPAHYAPRRVPWTRACTDSGRRQLAVHRLRPPTRRRRPRAADGGLRRTPPPAPGGAENVPRAQRFSELRALLEALDGAGYAVRYGVVDARDAGVAQSRRRLVLMAARDGGRCAAAWERFQASLTHAPATTMAQCFAASQLPCPTPPLPAVVRREAAQVDHTVDAPAPTIRCCLRPFRATTPSRRATPPGRDPDLLGDLRAPRAPGLPAHVSVGGRGQDGQRARDRQRGAAALARRLAER